MAQSNGKSVIPRLAWLGLALLLALPAFAAGWTAAVTTLFLIEFLTEGGIPALSAVTPSPRAQPLHLGGGALASLYRPFAFIEVPLVLVHGLAPLGRDDPRLQEAAQRLARAGFWVAVPTLPGLTALRLRPEDAEPVVAAIQAVRERTRANGVAVIGVSVGVGPALLAAADPRVAAHVRWVLSLGGYASTVELLRYFLTGHYRFGSVAGKSAPNPEGARLFLRANLDLVAHPEDRARLTAWLDAPGSRPPAGLSPEGAAVAALLENRDPARVEPLIDSLPPALRTLLHSLSPERVLPQLKGRLVLIHGRNDPAVPFTESLRLAAAARRSGVLTRLLIVGALEHVEPAGPWGHWWARMSDVGRLWAVTFDLFASL